MSLDDMIAAMAGEMLNRIRGLNARVLQLEYEKPRLQVALSLTDIPKCGVLTAAKTSAKPPASSGSPTSSTALPPDETISPLILRGN